MYVFCVILLLFGTFGPYGNLVSEEVLIPFNLLSLCRFMAAEGKSIPRSNLQLVGVSAMFLVSKIEEIYAPSISDFVYITDNAYSESEIRQMELRIIRALNFDLCQPISLNFLR